MLSPQWLDELRARVTLSSVIMRTTKLQRAGREWKACCPFHNEKTPSFTVSDEKGFYHCFGCGAHGDVIRWMTDQRGLAFMDAVRELAAEAGMEVPAPDPRMAQRAEQQAGLFVNPADGGPVMPTIAAHVRLLPKGLATKPRRSTDGSIFVVVEGRGTAIVEGARMELSPRDVFVVPSWRSLAFEATDDLVLFAYSDRAAQEKLGLFREERSG
ncbi:cupin domain-containing protein [Leptolyngbya sp. 15MV]|nr:cupin domain-containing protein [Leptolyngbya sp. 15MV]